MATRKKRTTQKSTTRRRSSTSRTVSSGASYAEMVMGTMAPRPKYIVVFKKPKESNVGAITKALGVKEMRGAGIRASVSLLESQAPGCAHPRIYHRLGIAATDLSDKEKKTMCADKDILAVVPNEIRTIPRPPQEAVRYGISGVASDPLMAYLHGMRDAADAALRYMTGTASQVAPVRLPGENMRPAAALRSTHSWCLDMVGIHPTYSVATGKGIKVAVLDTGIDLNHPDFSGALTEGDNAVSFVPGESVQDGQSHGTHCAGIVAGPINSVGGRRYGAAPDVQLLIGKVLNNAGSGFDDQILEGIDWAADMGAHIISMSLGSDRDVGGAFRVTYERVAEALLNDAGTGTLIVAAVGNESSRPQFTRPVGNPAACPSIMGVAAVDESRQVGWFSCRQMDDIGTLDISAPGVAVYSSIPGGGFGNKSGTSMATPYVAGLAALHAEHNPGISAKELWDKLVAQAIPLGDPMDFGAGLAQAPK